MFLNLITLLNWVNVYSHIRYLTSLPITLHYIHDSLRTVSSLHKYNIRYASKDNFHRPKVRTIIGKCTSKTETVPTNLKRLSTSFFFHYFPLVALKRGTNITSSNVSHSFELPIKIHFVIISNIIFWRFRK